MHRRLFLFTAAFGVFLTILFFNPYIVPGMYFDSSGSFRFQASIKVFVLSIINGILLIITLYKVFKTKELILKLSRIHIPLIIFLISIILSWLLSDNKTTSVYGFNTTLENSVIEYLTLSLFFILLLINIRKKLEVMILLYSLNTAISLITIWTIFRYTSLWNSHTLYLKDYVNSYLFTPTGHYGSLPILFIITFLTSFVFLQRSIQKFKKTIIILHALSLILSVIGFVTLYHVLDFQKATLYLAMTITALLLITYHIFKKTDISRSYFYTLGVMGIAILIGFGVYVKFTSNALSTFVFPATSPGISWNIAQKEISSNPKKLIFGKGESGFSTSFDEYKPGETSAYSLTLNRNVPIVPELRFNHAESFIAEVLLTQGYLGLLSFLSLILSILYFGYREISRKSSVFKTMLISIIGVLGASLFITGYDFILFYILIIFAAILCALVQDNEVLIKSDNAKFKPVVLIALLLIIVASGYSSLIGIKIIKANKLMAEGFQSRITGQQEIYKEKSKLASNILTESPIFARETINGEGVELLRALDQNAALQQNQDSLKDKAQQITSHIEKLTTQYPDDYKNYYLGGQFLSRISPYYNNDKDDEAIHYFLKSLTKNKNHPDSYFQLALLYERKKDIPSSISAVENAIRNDQTNLQYQLKYADLLAAAGDFKRALTIYEEFKNIVASNQNNTQLQNIYTFQKIEEKILQLKGKI